MSTLNDELAALKIDHSDRASGRRKGVWIGVLLVLVAIAAGGWYWTSRLQAVTVKVASAVMKSGAGSAPGAVLDASGYVIARRRATVSSKVTGKVVEVFVEEGQTVRQGQVLARLDDSQTRAGLALATAQLSASKKAFAEDQARLREAELNLHRRERLLQDGVVGRAEVDTARSEVDSLKARIAFTQEQVAVAEAQVNLRKTDLDDMVVRAPFSGVAISKDAQPGEMISPVSAGGGFTRTGIGTIVDMSSLEIEVDVNESFINRVRAGQKVVAVLDAYPDWSIPARVITTVPSADRQKATVRVRIAFDPREPQDRSERGREATSPGSSTSDSRGHRLDPRILPDMGVKVSFLRDEEPKAAAPPAARVSVPKAAVKSVDGRSVVFVVRDDRVERRAIRAGLENGGEVEVLSGVSAGERVVIEGPPTLKDGDRVRIQP
ncbi:MAG TPA: efflux RND transporter periplasmic adaptor subunit [Vicinamibacterales bacterium]|nr:efflux RND transporter periplasmic adaptor subunit [Vicinamibacterales bacterium]